MLTIDEIRDVKFRTKKGGAFYNAEDVDSFIDEIIETMEQKNSERAELIHKMDILATRVEQYRSDEETVRNALLSAQKVADSTLKEANEQSEVSLKNAEAKSTKMIADAEAKVAAEKKSLIELQKLVTEMREELLLKVKSCIDIVDTLPAEGSVKEIKDRLDREFPTPLADAMGEPEEVEEEVKAPAEEDVKVDAPKEEAPAPAAPVTENTTKFGVLKFGSNYDVE